MLDQLVQQQLVTDPASLWDLQAEQLEELPGWGQVSARNLLQELERVKQQPLHRLLFGLGIPHVGERAARLLAREFHSLAALRAAAAESIEAIDGLGPVMARSITGWLAEPQNQQLLERLKQRGVDPVEEVEQPSPDGELLAGGVQRDRQVAQLRAAAAERHVGRGDASGEL